MGSYAAAYRRIPNRGVRRGAMIGIVARIAVARAPVVLVVVMVAADTLAVDTAANSTRPLLRRPRVNMVARVTV